MSRDLHLRVVAALLLAALCLAVSCQDPEDPEKDADPTVGQVWLNEINADEEYIELYNSKEVPVSLYNWSFRKNGDEFFRFASNVTIPPKSFAVLNGKGNGKLYDGVVLGNCEMAFSGKKSLLVELRDASDRVVDFFVNSAQEKPRAADKWNEAVEQTFDVAGRAPDGEGIWYVLGTGTPGSSNTAAHQMQFFVGKDVDFSALVPNDVIPRGRDEDYDPDYVFDTEAIPEIRITITPEQWNCLLSEFDYNNNTKAYVRCNAKYTKDGDTWEMKGCGLRLRGNTSRRRPEGWTGQKHLASGADWHHCHFILNFHKYEKDDDHKIMGVKKVALKWHKDDAMYCRERYCYDLFRRYGVWTAIRVTYCRLWIYVEGDAKPAYFGVYELMECVDDDYIEDRVEQFGTTEGYLWKCSGGASLNSSDIGDNKFKYDDETPKSRSYELKGEAADFEPAKDQLRDFIKKLNSKTGDDFKNWIASVCDVELLLRTYAVNVAVGMWDDYWNDQNNFYMYFAGRSTTDYKFFFIPYDYDNTLGTTLNIGSQSDAVMHSPTSWGNNNWAPLIYKIIQVPEYRKIYLDALHELASDGNDYFNYNASASRIKAWHASIRDYISNDTGEDMRISDVPAHWSNHLEYRVLDTSSGKNFFQLKAKVLKDAK